MNYDRLKAVMLRQYYQWRHLAPKRLLYHPDSFGLRELLGADAEIQARAIDQRLRHVLSTAVSHVPFYRNQVHLRPREIKHEPLQGLLDRFPYIDKARVMACPSEFIDERRDSRFLHYATSHGSTGTGIGVWRSKRECDIEKAFYMHEWGKFGFDFDMSRYLRIGCDAVRPLDGPPTWRQGKRLMLSPDHIQPIHGNEICDRINRFRPQFIHAYPSTALALAELVGPAALDLQLRGIVLASEPAAPAQLALLGRVFNAPVSISYGLTERTNLAFSAHAQGLTEPYRLQPLYGWTETRRQTEGPEIVGTSLWNEVMPLIRYCTGDFAVIEAEGCCEAIQGRLQEFVVDRYGNRLPGLTIALDASTWDFVKACQLYQRIPGKVVLRVVPRHRGLTPEQRSALLAGPRRHWGASMDFDCAEVPEISTTPGGKRRFVVSDLLSG